MKKLATIEYKRDRYYISFSPLISNAVVLINRIKGGRRGTRLVICKPSKKNNEIVKKLDPSFSIPKKPIKKKRPYHVKKAYLSWLPKGFYLYKYQVEGVKFLVNTKKALLGDDMGIGKAQPLSSIIYTPNGPVKLGSLVLGDLVCCPDGSTAPVTGIFPQGIRRVYRITFSDGRSTLCTKDHLWALQSPYDRFKSKKIRVFPLKAFWKDIQRPNKLAYKWSLPSHNFTYFNEQFLYIDPYVLGVLLGDGCFGNSLLLTSGLGNLLEEVQRLLHPNMVLKQVKPPDGIDYRIIDTTCKTKNRYKDELRRLGLQGTRSGTKFIPDVYKYNSLENRISLLQGLIDTDSEISPKGCIVHTSKSKRLCKDIQEVVRSIGGNASYFERKGSGKYAGNIYGNVVINLPKHIQPARTKKRLNRYVLRKRKYEPLSSVVDVQLHGWEETQCISIDHPDKLYMTDEHISTHNTVQCLAAIRRLRDVRPFLIVSPACAKDMWEEEAVKWLGESIYVCEGKTPQPINKNASIIICNYEILSYWHDSIQAARIKGIAGDEIHKIKNHKTARSEAFRSLAKYKKYKFALSGTPVTNKPIEFWTILSMLCPEQFNDFWNFVNRYCDPQNVKGFMNYNGASNVDELYQTLSSTCMLRRLKEEVLPDLPPKVRSRQFLRLSNRMKYERAEATCSYQPADVEELRQLLIDQKLPAAIEWFSNFLESGEKLLIFVHHKSAASKIYEGLRKKYKSALYVGDTTKSNKRKAKEGFQEGDTQVLIGNLTAMGVALTLTACSNVAFFEYPWTPADLEQAEDRAYRISQLKQVNIWYLLGRDTYDDAMFDLLNSKREVLSELLNGRKISKEEFMRRSVGAVDPVDVLRKLRRKKEKKDEEQAVQ